MTDEQGSQTPIPDSDHDLASETAVSESDPNADSPEGLAGGMGVSSELSGHARGETEPVTYGTMPTHPDVDLDSGRPEQAPGGPDVNPDQPPLKEHHARDDG